MKLIAIWASWPTLAGAHNEPRTSADKEFVVFDATGDAVEVAAKRGTEQLPDGYADHSD